MLPGLPQKTSSPLGASGQNAGASWETGFHCGVGGGEVVGRMGGALSAVCHELDRFPRKRLCAHFALIASVTK